MKRKKILIAGGSSLLALNWVVSKRNFFDFFLGIHNRNITIDGANTFFIDLSSVDSIKKVLNDIKPHFVVNCVGLTDIERCEINPQLASYVNESISVNLANACKDLNISFIHISTDHLFDGMKSFVREDEQYAPLNVYAKTKANAEVKVLKIYPKSLIIRTNFYGWGTSYRESFSDIVIKSLRSEKQIELFDDVFYTPIVIEKLVYYIHLLIEKNQSGIFNIASAERISKFDFGFLISKVFGFDNSLIISKSINEKNNLTKRPYDMSLSSKKLIECFELSISNVFDDLEILKKQEQSGIAQELEKL